MMSTEGLKLCVLSLTRKSDCADMNAFSPPNRFLNNLANSKPELIVVSRLKTRCMYVYVLYSPGICTAAWISFPISPTGRGPCCRSICAIRFTMDSADNYFNIHP